MTSTPPKAPMRMREKVVLRVVSKTLIPLIFLFALYVQFHGDYGPGGGFQAGVLFAAGVVLYGLIFGLESARRLMPPRVVEAGLAVGVLMFAGLGLLTMALGGNFLDYNALNAQHPAHGQHWGILWIELGVGVTVTCAMVGIFFMFAGRSR
jgi:multicomponent Na+:H+ antiporter subunit B